MIERMADRLASSDLVPTAYRGKPANVVLASLAGRPFGWDPTMAMRSFHIIEGTPSMKPEVMLALVRRGGHSVSGEIVGDGAQIVATVRGKRVDTGDAMVFSFSVTDAVNAGLCSIDKDTGRPRSRSSQGKRLPWENHPKSMCWARALSQLCRMLFPDVVLGAGYTPEELGAAIADDDVIDVEGIDDVVVHQQVQTVTERQAKNALTARCGGDIEAAKLAWAARPESFKDGGTAVTGKMTDAKGEQLVLEYDAVESWIQSIEAKLERARADAAAAADDDVVDAEIVDETTPAADPPAGPPDSPPAASAEPAAGDVAPAPPSGQQSDEQALEELAYEQLMGEVGQMTVTQIGKELRAAGITPAGRKAELQLALVGLLLPQRMTDITEGRR